MSFKKRSGEKPDAMQVAVPDRLQGAKTSKPIEKSKNEDVDVEDMKELSAKFNSGTTLSSLDNLLVRAQQIKAKMSKQHDIQHDVPDSPEGKLEYLKKAMESKTKAEQTSVVLESRVVPEIKVEIMRVIAHKDEQNMKVADESLKLGTEIVGLKKTVGELQNKLQESETINQQVLKTLREFPGQCDTFEKAKVFAKNLTENLAKAMKAAGISEGEA